MAVIEYRAIATKVVAKNVGTIHVTSSVEGGKTVRMIFGLAPLVAIMEALKTEVLQIEGGDEKGE